MQIIDLPYFPYPRVVSGRRVPGYLFSWAQQCNGCNRQCESAVTNELSVCSYGVNYRRIARNQLIFGILVPGATATSAQKKALRQNKANRISQDELNRAVSTVVESQKKLDDEVDRIKDEIIRNYKENQQFKKDFLENLRPEIERNLAFLHDYKQFVTRVKQHINVVLQTRYGSEEIEQLLLKALPSEKAIYQASNLMQEKLETAFLLLHPERLLTPEKTIFRLHGMIHKYIKIYEAGFQDKGVKLEWRGESTGEILGVPFALGVIPQTLLDNALKYSVRGSKVVVEFKEFPDLIILSVMSHGPKIDPDEKSKIFDLFYRGRNAISVQEEGAGFGLYLAQFVAHSINSDIIVHQKELKTKLGFETTFSLRFTRVR